MRVQLSQYSKSPTCRRMLSRFSRVQLCDPTDCSPPGSSVRDSPGKNSRVGCHYLLQGIFPTQGLNPRLLYCRQILYSWVTREAQDPYIRTFKLWAFEDENMPLLVQSWIAASAFMYHSTFRSYASLTDSASSNKGNSLDVTCVMNCFGSLAVPATSLMLLRLLPDILGLK